MIYLKFKHIVTNKEMKSVQVVRCLTIGKYPMADIQLADDDTISRLHALIVPRPDGRLELRDLSSSTGTFVNERGQKRMLLPGHEKSEAVKGRATLADGDKFFVGKYCVELCYEELLGEPTLQELPEGEEEITGLEKIEDL